MGGQDHTVPEAITKSTLKQYRHSDAVTELEEFSDRGHSLTIDAGWAAVAEPSLTWLGRPGPAGSAGTPRRLPRGRIERPGRSSANRSFLC
jgi:hypothetical protein